MVGDEALIEGQVGPADAVLGAEAAAEAPGRLAEHQFAQRAGSRARAESRGSTRLKCTPPSPTWPKSQIRASGNRCASISVIARRNGITSSQLPCAARCPGLSRGIHQSCAEPSNAAPAQATNHAAALPVWE